MKRFCLPLFVFFYFTSLFCAANSESSTYQQINSEASFAILEQAQTLSRSGKFGAAKDLCTALLDWHNKQKFIQNTHLGYIHNLSHQINSESGKAATDQNEIKKALKFSLQVDNIQKNDVIIADISTLYAHASPQDRKEFIEALSSEDRLRLPPILNCLHTGHELIADLCRLRFKNEKEKNQLDFDARCELAESLLIQLKQNKDDLPQQDDINEANNKLLEICEYRPKVETPNIVAAHRNAWNLLANLAMSRQDYEDAIHYSFNSLYEEYNAQEEHFFPAHTPTELYNITYLMRHHECCRKKAYDLTNETFDFIHNPDDPRQNKWFLETLFSIAWKQHGLMDGGWLLAQHEQEYGSLENTTKILMELSAQLYPNTTTAAEALMKQPDFLTHWEEYASTQSAESKCKLKEIIIKCMDNREDIDALLRVCQTKEQKIFIWDTICKGNGELKSQAAFQQALLTDDIELKAALLKLAVTYQVPEAMNFGLNLCKELELIPSTRELHQALFQHGNAAIKTELMNLSKQVIRKLQINRFRTHWKEYASKKSNESRSKLEEIIIHYINNREDRETLLNICETNEQKWLIWDTIYKKSKGRSRFQAAFQQALLTDDVKLKAELLKSAVTNDIQEAMLPSFELCRQEGLIPSTKDLHQALMQHGNATIKTKLIKLCKHIGMTGQAKCILTHLAQYGGATIHNQLLQLCKEINSTDHTIELIEALLTYAPHMHNQIVAYLKGTATSDNNKHTLLLLKKCADGFKKNAQNIYESIEILELLCAQGYPNAAAELKATQFLAHWKEYTSTQSEESKRNIEELIIQCMHDAECRNQLLKTCETREQRKFTWETIFKKTHDKLKFRAAFQLAELIDDIPRKIILLQMALSNGIQDAGKAAFALCKEADCNESTRRLCSTLAQHVPKMHSELVAWLSASGDNTHAFSVLKEIADQGNIDAQLAYGVHCKKQYFASKDRDTTKTKKLKEQALLYLSKVAQQPKKYREQHMQGKLELSYLAKADGNLDKAKELVLYGAKEGHLDSQAALASYLHENALEHATALKVPPTQNKRSKKTYNPVANFSKQACDWFEQTVRDQNCSAQRHIDIRHEHANMHLHLAQIYKSQSQKSKLESQKKQWHSLSKEELNTAQEQLNLILKMDKNNARALSQLGVIHEQYDQHELALDLLLKACQSDPTYEHAFSNVVTICSNYITEVSKLNEQKEKAQDFAKMLACQIVETFVNRGEFVYEGIFALSNLTEYLTASLTQEFEKQYQELRDLLQKTVKQPDKLIQEIMKNYPKAAQSVTKEIVAKTVERCIQKVTIHIKDPIEQTAKQTAQLMHTNDLRHTFPEKILAKLIVKEAMQDAILKATNRAPKIQMPPLPKEAITELALAWQEAINQEATHEAEISSLLSRMEILAKKLIKLRPNYGNAWSLRGICANRRNHTTFAKECFEKGIEYGSPNAIYNLAHLYREGRHFPNKKRSSQNCNVECSGFLSDQTNDPIALQKAADLYNQILAANPHSPDAWYHLGLVNFAQGNEKQAIKCCQKTASLGQPAGHTLLAQFMMTGYGGYYNLEDAMWKLIEIQKIVMGNNDMLNEVQLLLNMAKYETINYLDNHAQIEIKKFFVSQEAPLNKAMSNISKQILKWIDSNPQQKNLRRSLAGKTLELLHKIGAGVNNDKIQVLYNQARKDFVAALRLDELNHAIKNLQNHTILDKTTYTERLCAYGLLNLYQAPYCQDLNQRKAYHEQALKYLEQASNDRNIYDFFTPRRIYFYASLLLDYPESLLRPIDTLTEAQKETIQESISLFEYITQNIARVQPHHFFVGKAYAYLADIQIRIYNDRKAARAYYQTGAEFGHVSCCLKLSRGYQIGSLTDDSKPDATEAKKWLVKAINDGHPKDPLYQKVQRDLWLLNHELNEETKDEDAKLFLQIYDTLKKLTQEKKYKLCDDLMQEEQTNMPLTLEERDAIYAQIHIYRLSSST